MHGPCELIGEKKIYYIYIYLVIVRLISSLHYSLSANDSLGSLVSTQRAVNSIAEDLFVKGNLLFSDGYQLRTTNLRTVTTTIVGANSDGYREDFGTEAYFKLITGFVQLTPDTVIISDGANNCLRLVDRKTQPRPT